MDEWQVRLANCFLAVFPELSADEISGATSASVQSWDSVAGVTLLAVVEEEFGVTIDSSDISNFSSYDGILQYLRGGKNGH
jgi:acyl carrier protein